jgi:uncharacterized protein
MDSRGSSARPRLADRALTELLAVFPAVMLLGPRSAGKTTTASTFARQQVRLDRPAEAAAVAADPDAALRERDEPLLLDEWQEVPEVLAAVKRSVDADSRPGRFLLTGSVRAPLQRSMWPGTGRVVELPIFAMTEREVSGSTEGTPFVDRLLSGALVDAPRSTLDIGDYVDLAVRGGYPDVALRGLNGAQARTWHRTYLDALVTRDVRTLSPRAEPTRLRHYLEAVALNTAGVPSDRTLCEAARITAVTGRHYDSLLADLFIAEELPAWSSNRLKRLMRRSKRLVLDSGLAAAASRVTREMALQEGDVMGRLLETLVAAQLRPEVALTLGEHHMFHLRTEKGRHEIDFLIELSDGRVVGVEVKATSAPQRRDAVHLEWLRDELGPTFAAGCVLHTGPQAFPLGDRVMAVPISTLWQ